MTAWTEAIDRAAAEWFACMARACWQGGLVIAAVWLLCRLLKKMQPEGRAWLWRLAYLKLLVALGWATPIVLAVLPPGPPRTPGPLSTDLGLVAAGRTAEPSTVPSPIPVVRADAPMSAPAPPAELATQLAAVPAVEPPTAPAGATLSGARRALLAIWLVGAGFVAAGIARRWVLARRLRLSSQPQDNARLADWFAESCGQLGLRRRPALAVSAAATGPMLLGVMRPVIVLPKTLLKDCSEAEVRAGVLHELAHVKRRDLLWNWLPTLGDVLFYWHPAVWLARRQWRLEQETACDRMAVSTPGSSVADLGTLLLKVVTRRPSGGSSVVAAAGLGESRSQIEKRLLAMKRFDPSLPKRKTTVAMLVLLVALLGVIPWQLTAAEPGGLVASVLSKLTGCGKAEAKASILVIPPESETPGTGATSEKEQIQHELTSTYQALVTSGPVLDRAAGLLATRENFDLDGQPREQWAGVLKKSLKAKVVPNTNIIEISYRAEDPQVAVAVVDAVLSAYLKFMDDLHKDPSREILDILTTEKVELDKELTEKRLELLDARRNAEELAITEGSEGVNVVIRRAINLNEAWIKAIETRLEAESQLRSLQAAIARGEDLKQHALAIVEGVGSEVLRRQLGLGTQDAYTIAQMNRGLVDDKAKLRSLRQTYGPMDRKVREIEDRISVTEQFIQNRARVEDVKLREMNNQLLAPTLLNMASQTLLLAEDHEERIRASYEAEKRHALSLAERATHLQMVEYDLNRLRAFQNTMIERIKDIDLQQDRKQIRFEILQAPSLTGPAASSASGEPGPPAAKVPSPNDEIRIEPGDTWEVELLGPDGSPDVSVRVRVGDDGTARVPLVGEIRLAGLTPEALRKKIAAAAVKHDVIGDPDDSVIHRLQPLDPQESAESQGANRQAVPRY